MIATSTGHGLATVGVLPTSKLSGVSAGSGSGAGASPLSGSGSGSGSAAVASLVDIQHQLGVDVALPSGGQLHDRGRPRTVSNLTTFTGGVTLAGTEDAGSTPPDGAFAVVSPGGLPRTYFSTSSWAHHQNALPGALAGGLLGGLGRERKLVRHYPCPSGCGHSCWAANDDPEEGEEVISPQTRSSR